MTGIDNSRFNSARTFILPPLQACSETDYLESLVGSRVLVYMELHEFELSFNSTKSMCYSFKDWVATTLPTEATVDSVRFDRQNCTNDVKVRLTDGREADLYIRVGKGRNGVMDQIRFKEELYVQ